MNLLLISNSTNAGEEYLQYPIERIGAFLAGVEEVAFVPYAAVTFSYEAYEAKVALVKKMQEQGLVREIADKIASGTPYVGWSAGSNVTCPTICTTNDMPIVQPESFDAIGAVKFQINPHYLDANPEGHAGETREQRIMEYIEANPDRWVAGLREGCMLHLRDGRMELIGSRPMRMFKKGVEPFEVAAGDDLGFLL